MANMLYDALFKPHEGSTKTFIDDPVDSGHTLSYKQFIEQSAQVGNALQTIGLSPGDRLLAQVGKSVSALALYAGCVRAGIVFLPLNTAYTASEVAYFVEDSGASLLICDPEAVANLKPVAKAQSASLYTMDKSGHRGSFIDLISTANTVFDTVPRSASDLAALLYTSGTTGRSKGAMLTQENLLSNAQALVSLWEYTSDDVLLHALPVFHTHGLFVASNTVLLAGAKMIFESKFDIDRMIARLPFSTSMMGVPTFYTRLLSDDRFD